MKLHGDTGCMHACPRLTIRFVLLRVAASCLLSTNDGAVAILKMKIISIIDFDPAPILLVHPIALTMSASDEAC